MKFGFRFTTKWFKKKKTFLLAMLKILSGVTKSNQFWKLGLFQTSQIFHFTKQTQPPPKTHLDIERIKKLAKETNLLYLVFYNPKE